VSRLRIHAGLTHLASLPVADRRTGNTPPARQWRLRHGGNLRGLLAQGPAEEIRRRGLAPPPGRPRPGEEPTRFLSTVQIGITLVGILAGAYGGASLADEAAALSPGCPRWPLTARSGTDPGGRHHHLLLPHHRRTRAESASGSTTRSARPCWSPASCRGSRASPPLSSGCSPPPPTSCCGARPRQGSGRPALRGGGFPPDPSRAPPPACFTRPNRRWSRACCASTSGRSPS
jgi:hypothetical protein